RTELKGNRIMKRETWLSLLLFPLSLYAAGVNSQQAGAAEGKLEFNRDIRPILADNCFACHGPDSASRKAGLRLDQRDAATKAKAIVPGNPLESALVAHIMSPDADEMMPPPATKK